VQVPSGAQVLDLARANCDIELRYQLRHRAVAPLVQRHIEALHEEFKQPLNDLSKSLLQAVKHGQLLRRWFGVRRDEKREQREDTVDCVIGQMVFATIDCLGVAEWRPPTFGNVQVRR